MLDINEIESTIERLENSSTSYDTCFKLAALYFIHDRYSNATQSTPDALNETLDNTEQELNDILPQYRVYCDVKRLYQMGQTSETNVQNAMADLCREIKEFLHILYSSTDTKTERTMIKSLLSELQATL